MAQKAGVCSILVQIIFCLGRPRDDLCVGNLPSDQSFGRLLASCQARPKGSVFCDDNFVDDEDDDDNDCNIVTFFYLADDNLLGPSRRFKLQASNALLEASCTTADCVDTGILFLSANLYTGSGNDPIRENYASPCCTHMQC